jgi:alpha-tubulin suppressor-like RCC1 family protein
LITWGWNEHGLCGNGNEDNILIPHQVAALTDYVIKMIGCGAGHSFAMINDT